MTKDYNNLLDEINKNLNNLENRKIKNKIINRIKNIHNNDKLLEIAGLLNIEISRSNRNLNTISTNKNPKDGDRVVVHYEGYLPNGKIFDSSFKKKTPFTFIVGGNGVIKGWNIEIKKMKLGQTKIIDIPHELGYGSKGVNGVIPPNCDLKFKVKILKIN